MNAGTHAGAGDTYAQVQRPVLQPLLGDVVEHWLLTFPDVRAGQALISGLVGPDAVCLAFGPRGAVPADGPVAEVSLGLTAEGLRRLAVPRAYLSVLARLAPAFMQGAGVRAAAHAGDTGPSAAAQWAPGFQQQRCHAILSVHTSDEAMLLRLQRHLEAVRVTHTVLPRGRWLGRPDARAGRVVQAGAPSPATTSIGRERWVHFGYRDGLSPVPVRGFPPSRRGATGPVHEPGEFVLGYRNDVGANPGLLPSAPRRIRDWLRDGSFGVLRQIEQDVPAFEAYVAARARELLVADDPAPGQATDDKCAYVKAKLCGRWPDGRHFALPAGDRARGEPDEPSITGPFDHADDPLGVGCPLASHIRRMNPRPGPGPAGEGSAPAHARPRVLLRRGMPYGDWDDAHRGLLGWFFCARLEDQFEHLLGEWADRMPLGMPGDRACKDPLIGQHDPGGLAESGRSSARFDAPVRAIDGTVVARTFPAPPPLSVTRGMAYAFYPSRSALQRIATGDYDLQDDPEQPEP